MNNETKKELIVMITKLRTKEFSSGWHSAKKDPRAEEEIKETKELFNKIFDLIYS